jgi:hypothetical protein
MNDMASPTLSHRRIYLPTFADLLDRMCIVQLKEIFLHEHRNEYRVERLAIQHDIDLIIEDKALDGFQLRADALHAIIVLMLANRFIWENEDRARQGDSSQDHLLRMTHSINGVRNTAKNKLSAFTGDRQDYKIDCFAADFVERYGNWNVF